MEYLFVKVMMTGIVMIFYQQEQWWGIDWSGKALSLPLNDKMKLKWNFLAKCLKNILIDWFPSNIC